MKRIVLWKYKLLFITFFIILYFSYSTGVTNTNILTLSEMAIISGGSGSNMKCMVDPCWYCGDMLRITSLPRYKACWNSPGNYCDKWDYWGYCKTERCSGNPCIEPCTTMGWIYAYICGVNP